VPGRKQTDMHHSPKLLRPCTPCSANPVRSTAKAIPAGDVTRRERLAARIPEQFLLTALPVMGDNWLPEAIEHQRAGLSARLAQPLARVAENCAPVWHDPEALDRVLRDSLDAVSPCILLYAVDTDGRQRSANVFPGLVDPGVRGQDLGRPAVPGGRGALLRVPAFRSVCQPR